MFSHSSNVSSVIHGAPSRALILPSLHFLLSAAPSIWEYIVATFAVSPSAFSIARTNS